MPAPIPLLVLGGFLGAGKTTLLNHLLTGSHGQRVAVLVNDFGAIAVDSRLVTATDGETIALSNGCICCSIGSSLMETLLRLLVRPDPPERLVIEASGIADPARIAAIGLAGDAFRLEAIVTVVDAETVRQRADDPLVGDTVRAQIAAADLLILNKLDLVDTVQAAAAEDWLGDLTTAPVVRAVQSNIPHELLVGLTSDSVPLSGVALAGHAAAFTSWALPTRQMFRREVLARVFDGLGDRIWRAKGFLRLAEQPAAPQLLQLVGRRWSLSPAPPNVEPEGLVLIGPLGTDGQAAIDALRSALV